ncbi:MAG: DUF2793 domain-containing protein [Aquamicrobium sp.]|uniref:DUF2793 domain-containing protein n=1 Tax=Aquamicrobium sp. TaxID=1872579 RepID=UPI00349EBB21|nr:DUF2793 domain-containing protein [Aquamicrobium sp.]
MVATPKLGVRLMASNDVQKEVVFNEAAVVFDAMVARSAKNRQNNPPGSPADGDTYIVGTGASGAWSGHANKIALWFNGWRFYSPLQKMKFFNEATSTFWTYSGAGWTQDPAGTPSTLDDLTNVGIVAPEDGDVLTFNASDNRWEAQAPAAIPPLGQLADINLNTLLDGQILVWNETGSQWVNSAPPSGGGGGATALAQLTDVEMNSPSEGDLFMWDNAAGKAMFKEFEFPAAQLNDLNDVVAGGAQQNDVLAWNGAAWVPSPAAITYSFLGMVDGPQTFDGYADHFLVVDPTESFLRFMSLSELLSGATFNLADFPDVEAPSDTHLNKFLKLTKVGGTYQYVYDTVNQTNYSIGLTVGGTAMTSRIRQLYLNGFNVIEDPDNDGFVTITASNVLEFQADGDALGGDVSAINFTGNGINVTLIDDVLTVDIGETAQAVALSDLDDVQFETPPVDGNVLKFDALSQKWGPGTGSGGGPNIDQNEYVVATYELGPFAPPTAEMFPGRHNAPSADLTAVKGRGLVIQGGPQTSGVRHAVVYRQLEYDLEPWMVTARVVPDSFMVAGHAGGIVVQRAFNGAFVFLALGNSNSDTQFSLRLGWVSAAGAETILLTEPNQYNWLRLGFDGNHIRAWVSSDGLVWQVFGNPVDPSTTLQGVPDRVGITNRSNATHDGTCGTLLTYWEDPDFPAGSRIQQGTVSLGLGALQDVDMETAPPVDGQTIVWNEMEAKWVPGEAGGVIEQLGDIEDVDLDTQAPADGEALVWDEAGQKWVPGSAAAETLGDIGDVDLTDLEDGQSIVWSEAESKWLPGAGAPETLGEIGDVDLAAAPVDGNSLVFDGTLGRWVAGAGFGNVATEFDISLFIPGTPDAESVIARYITAREYTLAADLEDSFAYAETAADGEVIISIQKNGTMIGSVTFAFATNDGVFAFDDPVGFAPGDRLTLVSPLSLQNLADISITFAGSRI